MTARCRRFADHPDSIVRARRFVREVLRPGLPDLLDVAVLLVSELATNAVEHAHSDFTVAIDATADGARLSVSDSGPGQPVLRVPEPTALSGRGLHTVELLSESWGITQAPAGGKAVWFTLRTPGRSGPSPAGTADDVLPGTTAPSAAGPAGPR